MQSPPRQSVKTLAILWSYLPHSALLRTNDAFARRYLVFHSTRRNNNSSSTRPLTDWDWDPHQQAVLHVCQRRERRGSPSLVYTHRSDGRLLCWYRSSQASLAPLEMMMMTCNAGDLMITSTRLPFSYRPCSKAHRIVLPCQLARRRRPSGESCCRPTWSTARCPASRPPP